MCNAVRFTFVWRTPQMQGCGVFLTEWNSNSLFQNILHDMRNTFKTNIRTLKIVVGSNINNITFAAVWIQTFWYRALLWLILRFESVTITLTDYTHRSNGLPGHDRYGHVFCKVGRDDAIAVHAVVASSSLSVRSAPFNVHKCDFKGRKTLFDQRSVVASTCAAVRTRMVIFMHKTVARLCDSCCDSLCDYRLFDSHYDSAVHTYLIPIVRT